jgi:hypothetical protein
MSTTVKPSAAGWRPSGGRPRVLCDFLCDRRRTSISVFLDLLKVDHVAGRGDQVTAMTQAW